MKKKIISILVLFIIILHFISINIQVIAVDYVEIKDENLKKSILRQLGLEETHQITKQDMESLWDLAVLDAQDFSGIEYATNLEYLTIDTYDGRTREKL